MTCLTTVSVAGSGSSTGGGGGGPQFTVQPWGVVHWFGSVRGSHGG